METSGNKLTADELEPEGPCNATRQSCIIQDLMQDLIWEFVHHRPVGRWILEASHLVQCLGHSGHCECHHLSLFMKIVASVDGNLPQIVES